MDTVLSLHDKTVRQVQELLKAHIVPAILDHDEMARGSSELNYIFLLFSISVLFL